MRALTSTPADDLRRLRHTVATAIERLRALELAPGDAATAREVACTALGALSTTLFVGGDTTGPQVPPSLVEDDIRQIAELLDLEPARTPHGQSTCLCLTSGLPPEPTTVSS